MMSGMTSPRRWEVNQDLHGEKETEQGGGERWTVRKRGGTESEYWPFTFGVKGQEETSPKQGNPCDLQGQEFQCTLSKLFCAWRGTEWPLIFSKSIILLDFFAREFLLLFLFWFWWKLRKEVRLSSMEKNRKHVSRNRNSQIKASMSSQVPLGIPLQQGFRPQPVWD